MTKKEPESPGWWARGLLFENCSCQSVCPGHVHFSQLCTLERCVGYWAVRFDEGRLDGASLDGVKAVIAYDAPQHMIDGDWVQTLIVDEAASPAQRTAVERLFAGQVGGPWSVLARFVGRRLATRFLPIRIEDQGRVKRVVIDGVGEGTVEAVRGRDRSQPVTFENMFNQIHASRQVIAQGATRYDDGTIRVDTEGTHGLWSDFSWSG